MARDGLKRLDVVWHVKALRYWMECGLQWPREIGWSVAREGLKILDGVWHIRAERYWMEFGILGPKDT